MTCIITNLVRISSLVKSNSRGLTLSLILLLLFSHNALARSQDNSQEVSKIHRNLPVNQYLWISPEEIALLPDSGPAWDAMKEDADAALPLPDLSDQNSMANVKVLAKALVYVRTGIESYRTQVIAACIGAIGTENDATSLAVGRELMAYVIAAQLVVLPEEEEAIFTQWLKTMLDKDLSNRTLRSTHEERANNWGNMAGASRMAVALYLNAFDEFYAAAMVFKGWLGDRKVYSDFKYGSDLTWQADPEHPVGINPQGATINGYNVDGALPEEQRRSGSFSWPPPYTNYTWEALQGVVSQAEILTRQGYDAYLWSNKAIYRAVRWAVEVSQTPATGDDNWQPHIINYRYASDFPTQTPTNPGKLVGYADWTHPN